MSKRDKELDRQLDALAVLGEPARRELYLYVQSSPSEVSREEAARAVKISRALAAFHLDKLVEAELLEVSYRRLTGRSGPGAGRPSKLYRRSVRQIDVTLPARRYELAAQLMARAMVESGPSAAAALDRTAEAWGNQIGCDARARTGGANDPASSIECALAALRSAGFEPERNSAGEILLGNCPFDALRSTAPLTICGMNLALCKGLIAGLAVPGWSVRLEPDPDRCCVILQTP